MENKIILAIFVLSILVIGSANALENGVTIPLVAARMSDTGEQGAILNAQVYVTNGTGHVFVDTNPFTQVDLQGSARIAASVASDVLGVDERSYDFYYVIDIGSPIIGGPSAGGALTVATIAAMKNWTIKPNIAMTGMIDPDETIGPVGGINFKLEAAAAQNTSLFLVPQGQLIVNTTNTSTVRQGPFITTKTTEEPIDLVQLGKKLNVDVKEVNTIQDAVLIFTGHDISKPISNNTVFTTTYLNRLEPLALQLQNESKEMYKNISSINNDLIKNAADLQNKGDDQMNNKKYYAATSLYFESMINILAAKWQHGYDSSNNKDQYLADIKNTVETDIKNSENSLAQFKSNGITDIEVIGAAESRIMAANDTLENIKSLTNTNDIIASYAFADERSKTALWWLSLAGFTGKVIPEDIVKERSGWYLGQAQSIDTYVHTLLSESGTSLILTDTTPIQKEIDKGYYSGAIFDSLQAISRSSTAIELLGVQDPSARINQNAGSAQTTINEARSEGIEPTLAVSAFEYAGSLTNPYDKITQYAYSKNIAKITESLYSLSVPSNQTIKTINPIIQTTTITPNMTTNQSSQKSPAFEAILLLIAILLLSMKIKRR